MIPPVRPRSLAVVALALALPTLAAAAPHASVTHVSVTHVSVTHASVTHVRSRPALAGDIGVVYATLTAPRDRGDRLVAVTSPVAKAVEIHESMAMPMSGMTMKPVAGIDVPAGGSVALAPGGYHVMLIGLHRALVAGTSVPVTFVFAHAGRIATRSRVAP